RPEESRKSRTGATTYRVAVRVLEQVASAGPGFARQLNGARSRGLRSRPADGTYLVGPACRAGPLMRFGSELRSRPADGTYCAGPACRAGPLMRFGSAVRSRPADGTYQVGPACRAGPQMRFGLEPAKAAPQPAIQFLTPA